MNHGGCLSCVASVNLLPRSMLAYVKMSLKRPKVEPGSTGRAEPEDRLTELDTFTKNKIVQFKHRRIGEIMDIIMSVFQKNRTNLGPTKYLTQKQFMDLLEGKVRPTPCVMCQIGSCYDVQCKFPYRDLHNKWKELKPTDSEQKTAFLQLEKHGFLWRSGNDKSSDANEPRQYWKWTHLGFFNNDPKPTDNLMFW